MTRFYATATALVALALAAPAAAQSLTPSDPGYDAWKTSQIGPEVAPPPAAAPAAPARTASVPLLIPYADDGTWTEFPANDDGSAAVAFGFDFEYYGDTFASGWVNNNGNITVDGPQFSFSPVGFPSNQYAMIAGFWGDVDTRGGDATGLAYYKQTTYNGQPVFVAHWEAVGYFNQQSDKLNTFQIVLADEAILPGGGNVCFGYGDMNWTTGSASNGVNGFGGSPATVGANKGDGTAYFQVGLFDQAGDAYDGPEGSNDGVDFLDGRQYCFNTGRSVANVPPIPQGISDGQVFEFIAGQSDPALIDFSFLSPESGQTTTITVNDVDGQIAAQTLTPGNPATGQIQISTASGVGVDGDYTIEITATDDGTPAESTTITIIARIGLDTRQCEPGNWYVFDFDADGDGEGALDVMFSDGEYVRVYAAGPGNLDLSNCTLTAWDATTETVVLSIPLTGVVLSPFADVIIADGGVDFPEGSIPDGPGAIAFVQGPAPVGTPVANVIGNVANAIVYYDDDNMFAVFPAGSPLDPGLGASLTDMFGGAVAAEDDPEAAFALSVAPNPVRAAATVTFSVPEAADVRVAVYDALGREVAVAAEGPYGPGRHTAPLDTAALPAGVYVVRATAGAEALATPFTIVR